MKAMTSTTMKKTTIGFRQQICPFSATRIVAEIRRGIILWLDFRPQQM
jgi:hypothetical protein